MTFHANHLASLSIHRILLSTVLLAWNISHAAYSTNTTFADALTALENQIKQWFSFFGEEWTYHSVCCDCYSTTLNMLGMLMPVWQFKHENIISTAIDDWLPYLQWNIVCTHTTPEFVMLVKCNKVEYVKLMKQLKIRSVVFFWLTWNRSYFPYFVLNIFFIFLCWKGL